MSYSTAETILDSAWKVLRTEGGSTDVPALQEAFMLVLLSQANMEWLRAHRRGGGSGPLVFLRETGFDLTSDTSLNQATLAAGDPTMIVTDSSSFESTNGAGVLWNNIMPDVFSYTTNVPNTFSGVTGVAFAHTQGEVVQRLYRLPSDFKTFRPSESYGDGVMVNSIPHRFMEGPPLPFHFSMYDDGTYQWLWLPRAQSGKASVLYERNSSTIDSTEDTVDVPQEYEFFLVWRIVQLASVPKEGGQPSQLYMLAKGEANRILSEALKDKNIGQHARARQFPILRRYRDPSLYTRVPR